jgi:cohesin complex subunit SCC1
LPDVLTEIDLLAPMPDPSFLLSQPLLDLDHGLDNSTAPDWDNSQFLSNSIEQPRLEPMMLGDPDELHIDIGEDLDDIFEEGTSIERGREAPLERRMSEELAESPKQHVDDGDDLGIDTGEDLTDFPAAPDVNIDFGDTDINMGGMTELEAPADLTITGDTPFLERHDRESLSPLSSIRSSVERDLEETFQQEQHATVFEPQPEEQEEEEDESVHHANRAKRRRVLEADTTTQISQSQIRDLQSNRDKILKPATFLPRDPLLLALMNMQKSGGFVSSILGDGRSQGWAPELRGILSFEVVSRPQKRKRDSGVADLDVSEEEAAAGAEKTPQLEFEEAEPELDDFPVDIGGDTSLGGQDDEQIQLPEDEGFPQLHDEPLEEDQFSPVPDNFDDTTAPILYPADSGPISLGTKHAVHILRELFGHDEETSESQHQRSSVLFHEMLPEATTTKAEATKMFFEILVLATKDAIKVDQKPDVLGGPLRIRGKRGLYGTWAETSAGGELATQEGPGSRAASVAVEVEA